MKLVIKGDIPSQKNDKEIGWRWSGGKKVPFIRSSQRTLDWKEDAIIQLKQQWQGYKMTGYPIEISLVFFFGNNNRHDLDNAAAGIMDALSAAGVIEDDNIKFVDSLNLQYGGFDKNNPRAEIYFDE